MEHMAYMTSASLFLKTKTTKNAIPSKISQVLAISLHLTLLFLKPKVLSFTIIHSNSFLKIPGLLKKESH